MLLSVKKYSLLIIFTYFLQLSEKYRPMTSLLFATLLPAPICVSGIWSERGNIKPPQHQGTTNVVYSVVKLQPESCDALSARCGASTATVD